jgi:hypothetical protein
MHGKFISHPNLHGRGARVATSGTKVSSVAVDVGCAAEAATANMLTRMRAQVRMKPMMTCVAYRVAVKNNSCFARNLQHARGGGAAEQQPTKKK